MKQRRLKKRRRRKKQRRHDYEYESPSPSASSASSDNSSDNDDDESSSSDSNATHPTQVTQADPDYYDEDDRKMFADPSEKMLPWFIFYGCQAPVLVIIFIIWWSSYEWHPSVRHRDFWVSPTECLCVHAVLTTALFASSVYVWWVQYIGGRCCTCCCLVTTLAYRLSVRRIVCPIFIFNLHIYTHSPFFVLFHPL